MGKSEMNLPPGRKLDCLVALKLFGWIFTADGELGSPERNCIGGLAGITLQAVPFYSTDISAAWEVVEKIDLFFEVSREEKNRWTATFYKDPFFDVILGHARAKTAPHAICLAALKIMEVKK